MRLGENILRTTRGVEKREVEEGLGRAEADGACGDRGVGESARDAADAADAVRVAADLGGCRGREDIGVEAAVELETNGDGPARAYACDGR